MKKYTFLLGYLFLLSNVANAQSKEERKKIATQSNFEGNIVQLAELKKEDNDRKIRLSNFLAQNPTFQKTARYGEMGIRELIDVLPNGELKYVETYNDGAATTARAKSLYNGGSLGINIQGQGMKAGIWDGGSVRTTHQEFMVGGVSKVEVGVDNSPIANHATHVGGTIAAQGISALSRGLAFNASLISYDWTNDLSEMVTEASNGLLTSNHSYGPVLFNDNELWQLGAYMSDARQLDNMCFNNPFYLPVFAAGNDRAKTTIPYITQRNNKAGYDLIAGDGVAKNVLTVAAVEGLGTNLYTQPADVIMSSFSNWGPTDDGRIKPDISTKGISVRSSTFTSDTSYGFMDGTSMAAPGVTGVILLLQQYYNQLNTNYMKAATAKGLILHTADEAGEYPGPDYQFGWGLINAQKAAVAIRDKNSTSTSKSFIEELTLANNATYTKTITSTSSTPLKVSISWTDRWGSAQNTGAVDQTTIRLVNDLDVKITKNDTTYYPWKLQGLTAYYDAASNNSTNNVDNFERVDINNPVGTYTITVSHKGTLTGGSQNFSLIVTGDNLGTLSTQEVQETEQGVIFYPNPAKDFIYVDEKEKNLLITVYDASGKLVITNKTAENKINISRLVKGNYIANYTTLKGVKKSFKFIKE
ncbi:S8 family serine peptidase [Chryseobacterium wangxinyae]|uniref:S8 family serine peptidase n=1 Tax=Chryseobacterium sp. CY353 TaxID=2997334 RepID=UPI002271E87C|nr:S8 family serine peptidase [Chryseobacterium sp. CY353]MCY0969526.1 S8 family serine peptidase [Chryseobacterium sp. CY353]